VFILHTKKKKKKISVNSVGGAMAAPETPLNYVGVARKSAAFRLMKQMVLFSLSLSIVTFSYYWFCILILLNSIHLLRDGKKEKVLAKKNKGSKDTFVSPTNKTLLVSFLNHFHQFTVYSEQLLIRSIMYYNN